MSWNQSWQNHANRSASAPPVSVNNGTVAPWTWGPKLLPIVVLCYVSDWMLMPGTRPLLEKPSRHDFVDTLLRGSKSRITYQNE